MVHTCFAFVRQFGASLRDYLLVIMSNYPPPQYGGGYGTPDQSNMPYLPPAYPQQYYQQDSTRGAHVQMNTQMNAATGNYNSYGYNHLAPGFNSTVGAPAISPMPIFQGWNQDSLPLPPFTTAPQQSSYSAYNGAYQQTQYGVPANQNSWSQPPANNAKAVEQSDLSEGEYDDSAMPNNHVSSQDYSTAHFQQNSSIAQSRQPPVNGRFNHEGSPSHQSSTYGNINSSVSLITCLLYLQETATYPSNLSHCHPHVVIQIHILHIYLLD